MSAAAPPRLIDPARHGWAAARLAALMIASALTEGLGVVLLVPMLAVLSGGGAAAGGGAGRIAGWLARIGVPAALGPLLAVIVALTVLRGVINAARQQSALRLEFALVDGLRDRAWRALLHCDWRVLVTMNRADNASLLITRIDQAGTYVNQAITALTTAATLGGIGIAALAIAPRIALAALAAGLAVLGAYHGMRRRAADLGEAVGATYTRIFGELQEGLGALRVIKSHGREDRAARDLAGEFAALRASQLAYVRDLGRGDILLQGGGAAVLALLIWAALSRWHADIATVLPMVALFARALPLLGILQQSALEWAHSRPAVQAALALIATAEAAHEPPGERADAPTLARELVVENAAVRFSPDSPPALAGVSLRIAPRGITALIGPSGAGKSTLADLLGGLLSPDSGTVSVDAVELTGPARRGWRERVAYVQQEAVLASGTVREALRWADPAADDAALAAALAAAAAGFALALPQGLDTVIGDGGRVLSGGEKQRLALARALLRDPALLILDEATSALDPANEALVARAISRLAERMAVLIIGHRGALLAIAGQRVTLEGGRIVAIEHGGDAPPPTPAAQPRA